MPEVSKVPLAVIGAMDWIGFSTHAAIDYVFNVQSHLISRKTLRQFRTDANAAWTAATLAA